LFLREKNQFHLLNLIFGTTIRTVKRHLENETRSSDLGPDLFVEELDVVVQVVDIGQLATVVILLRLHRRVASLRPNFFHHEFDPGCELYPLGDTLAPEEELWPPRDNFAPRPLGSDTLRVNSDTLGDNLAIGRGEHALLFKRMEGQTENFHP
jgi:hypothetical protein